MMHDELREAVARAIHDAAANARTWEASGESLRALSRRRADAAIRLVAEACADMIERRAYEERTIGHVLPPDCPVHRADIVKAIRALATVKT